MQPTYNSKQLRNAAFRRIAKPNYCPADAGTFFRLALLINICTFNKRFGGQTDEVS
jgi:hypothetical protein